MASLIRYMCLKAVSVKFLVFINAKSPRVQQNMLDCAQLLSVWSVLLLSLHCLCIRVSLSVLLFCVSYCKSGFVWGNKPVSGRFQCKSVTLT